MENVRVIFFNRTYIYLHNFFDITRTDDMYEVNKWHKVIQIFKKIVKPQMTKKLK